jgi:hypothetical protein
MPDGPLAGEIISIDCFYGRFSGTATRTANRSLGRQTTDGGGFVGAFGHRYSDRLCSPIRVRLVF